MDKFVKWIEKNKKKVVIAGFLLIFLPVIIIHFLFKIESGCYWIEATWTSGDILGYFGDVLSFLGTVVLGYVAISQTEKANKLNEELLQIEKKKIQPCFDVKPHLYNIYLADDMNKVFLDTERQGKMMIELTYAKNPRTGIVVDCALLELEAFNSGGSDIRQIYVKSPLFYLCVKDPYIKNEKMALMMGDSSLKKGESKTLYIYVKREIDEMKNISEDWYEKHIDDLMPHMEFELVLETTAGERYSEKIVCGSGWDISMQNIGKTAIRQIGISKINVTKC